MSYSRKTLGFIVASDARHSSQELFSALRGKFIYHTAHFLRSMFGHDQHGIAGGHHHDPLDAHHAQKRSARLGHHHAAIAGFHDGVARDEVPVIVGGPNFTHRRPTADIAPT